MGLTLLAILTGALILPGLVAVFFFYRSGRTKEADPILPEMSSAAGLVQIGCLATLVHLVYAFILWALRDVPLCCNLPPADPYRALDASGASLATSGGRLGLFAGLFLLLVLAAVLGSLVGKCFKVFSNRAIFHGPLIEIIEKADGPDAWITAFVLTRIENGDTFLGYEGVVTSLTRDADLLPAKVVLRDVRQFRILISEPGSQRKEEGKPMDYLILNATDWHNIAFRVYLVED